jgi:hypothetical protein
VGSIVPTCDIASNLLMRTRPRHGKIKEHEKDEPDVPRGLAFSILRLVAALPIVRQFGELLLLIAQSPVRLPVEGEHRSGSRVAKGVYRSYMHKKNQEPSWVKELVRSSNSYLR